MAEPVFTQVDVREPKLPHRRRGRRAAADRGCGARARESHPDGDQHHCDRHRSPGTLEASASTARANGSGNRMERFSFNILLQKEI